jgi:hypothetical protein
LRYRSAVTGLPHVDDASPEIQGILLALEATAAEESVFPVLADALHEPALAAWRSLRALDDATRSRLLATWRARAASGLPSGFSFLHPSWAAEALAREPQVVVAAIRGNASGVPSVPRETARELARLAFSHLAPLCESEPGPRVTRLLALEPEDLVAELKRRGARTVGRSLAGTPPTLRARAMAGVGEPWAREIAAASMAAATSEERADALTLAGAGSDCEGWTAEQRLLAIGIAATRAEFGAEGSGALARLAGRLPAALGRGLIGW